MERKDSIKRNKIGHLETKNYKFEKVENFKYLEVILNEDNNNEDNNNEDNNNQTDLQERIKNAKKTYFMLQTFFKNKYVS